MWRIGSWLLCAGGLWACVPMERVALDPPAFAEDGSAGDRALWDGPPADRAPPDPAGLDRGPADGAVVDGARVDAGGLDGATVDGAAWDAAPAWDGAPADGAAWDGAPADGAVGDGAPADGADQDAAPADLALVDQTPPDQDPNCAPEPERCNGQDDDCDGRVDEDPLGAPPADENGRCRLAAAPCVLEAEWRCHAGRWVCRPDPELPLGQRARALSGCRCEVSGQVLPHLRGMRCRERLPWPAAAAACAGTWMRLVIIEDRDHANLLQQLGLLWREVVWVGLARDAAGVLRWLDGRLAEEGFTLGLDLDEDPGEEGGCVSFDLGRGRLRADRCLQGRAFLCEDIPAD